MLPANAAGIMEWNLLTKEHWIGTNFSNSVAYTFRLCVYLTLAHCKMDFMVIMNFIKIKCIYWEVSFDESSNYIFSINTDRLWIEYMIKFMISWNKILFENE